jgi:hypothetical protein
MSSFHTTRRLLTSAAASLVFAGTAAAQSTVYTTLASFLANVAPGAITETFNGAAFAPGSLLASPFSFAVGGTTVTATAAGGSTPIYISESAGPTGKWLGNAFGNQALTLTFSGAAVTAIGGNFFLSNSADAFVSGPMSISLSDGTSVTFTPGAFTDFRGFVSAGAAITSVTMAAPGTSRFNSVDNLVLGSRLTSVVPEPASIVLTATGLFAIGLTARRRRVVR